MERKQKETEDFSGRDFLQGKDLSNQNNYGRPPVPPGLNDRTDDIVFMQVECDYYSKAVNGGFESTGEERKLTFELSVTQTPTTEAKRRL